MDAVPQIDVRPLVEGRGDEAVVADAIDAACRELGFFTVVGHGIDRALVARVEELAREFFALSEEEKGSIAMPRAGRAWRGWFPLGGELTSGAPDRKEGLYFGVELDVDDPRATELPLHGSNLFPTRPAALRVAVLEYMSAFTDLGHRLARGLALALGLDPEWFREHLTADPVVLFRIFRYPPAAREGAREVWGVGEHTDYGLLTILHQDGPGLEVKSDGRWQPVPPVDDALVCNLGDMVELMTGGRYRSTPHRVRNESRHDRLSLPFFFDPSWDAVVRRLPGPPADPVVRDRWDAQDVFAFRGTYGDYLVDKVARVFPDLRKDAL